MIVVTATMTVAPEHAEEFLAAARTVIAATTTEEPGCQSYDCSRDVSDETRFVFLEEWDDMAAIGAHVQTAHYLAFDEVAQRVVAEREVTLHTVEKSRTV